MEKRHQAAKLIVAAVIVVIAVLFLAGVIGGADVVYRLRDSDAIEPFSQNETVLLQKVSSANQ